MQRLPGLRGDLLRLSLHSQIQQQQPGERSRVRVIREPLRDIYVPVYAGEYTAAECAGRDKYTIDGKEYDECAFCRASCPSRDLFKEPDSGLPLKCDMCEGRVDEEPLCVKWCIVGRPDLRGAGRSGREEARPWRKWMRGWRPWPTSTWLVEDNRRRRPDVAAKQGLGLVKFKGLGLSGVHRGNSQSPSRKIVAAIKEAGGEAYRFKRTATSAGSAIRRLPLEPGDGLQHPQDRPAGQPRTPGDRAARTSGAAPPAGSCPSPAAPGASSRSRWAWRSAQDRHRATGVPGLCGQDLVRAAAAASSGEGNPLSEAADDRPRRLGLRVCP